MLASAEIGHVVSKRAYARAEPKLREALLNAQYDLAQSGRGPVVVLLSGVQSAGRSEIANTLNAWMDPRHIRVSAFGPPTAEERAHPPAWRQWIALPPRGALGVFFDAWYADAFAAGLGHDGEGVHAARLEAALAAVRTHERMLDDDGLVFAKFWLHLSQTEQKKRFEALEDDPRTRWRVTRQDWKRWRRYNELHDLWEHTLRETSVGAAPWYVVEGADFRYRNLTVGRILLDVMRQCTTREHPRTRAVTPLPPSVVDNVKLVRELDLTLALDDKTYEREIEEWQGRLARLTRRKRFARRSLVLAFEGVDAAGKGGAIRRVTGALDTRQYVTVPIAAPTDEDKLHPYLWRFWRHVPRRGGITIFDRSWYGRVLVERVEGLCTQDEWMRAYDEINNFESALTEGSVIVVKFWLQISKAEQLKRFRARQTTPFKRFKITAEDWRNRRKWGLYEAAVADMIDRTSTEIAPWTLVEAEDKRYARIKILRALVERLEREL